MRAPDGGCGGGARGRCGRSPPPRHRARRGRPPPPSASAADHPHRRGRRPRARGRRRRGGASAHNGWAGVAAHWGHAGGHRRPRGWRPVGADPAFVPYRRHRRRHLERQLSRPGGCRSVEGESGSGGCGSASSRPFLRPPPPPFPRVGTAAPSPPSWPPLRRSPTSSPPFFRADVLRWLPPPPR